MAGNDPSSHEFSGPCADSEVVSFFAGNDPGRLSFQAPCAGSEVASFKAWNGLCLEESFDSTDERAQLADAACTIQPHLGGDPRFEADPRIAAGTDVLFFARRVFRISCATLVCEGTLGR